MQAGARGEQRARATTGLAVRYGLLTTSFPHAGDPVAGAQVKIGGRTGMTNAAGKVISIPGGRWNAAVNAARLIPRRSIRWFSGKLSASRRKKH